MPLDSVDKIITRYFASVASEPFEYKKKSYQPTLLRVSPDIFTRQMTCVANCGACCTRFSLDYLPGELHHLSDEASKRLEKREIEFSGRKVTVYSDLQQDHSDYYCRHLRREDGRCKIHGSHPFSCDFELLRFYHHSEKVPDRLSHSPFGRAWNMKRIDGDRGALCEWYDQPCDDDWKQELNRKLAKLKDWADYFGLSTYLPGIMDWISKGPHMEPLVIGRQVSGGFDV